MNKQSVTNKRNFLRFECDKKKETKSQGCGRRSGGKQTQGFVILSEDFDLHGNEAKELEKHAFILNPQGTNQIFFDKNPCEFVP